MWQDLFACPLETKFKCYIPPIDIFILISLYALLSALICRMAATDSSIETQLSAIAA